MKSGHQQPPSGASDVTTSMAPAPSWILLSVASMTVKAEDVITIRIDDRRDRTVTASDKVESVLKRLR